MLVYFVTVVSLAPKMLMVWPAACAAVSILKSLVNFGQDPPLSFYAGPGKLRSGF